MTKWISELYCKLLASLDNHSTGFSARKLSALCGIITSIYLSIKHSNSDNADSLIITWLAFVGACLGMATFGRATKEDPTILNK